ncbi:unnamed protein product [Mytilus coruscus]|uniref:Uncharacterized protein n=1 Tax=Mytilus coruscus TaxID=42192 RepID=A0A6J8BJV0_MYTCO|nr:unnamed protein product [Mytilus coruscus]
MTKPIIKKMECASSIRTLFCKSRLVKVLYQGGGDNSQTRAVAQIQSCFKGGLTQVMADMVNNQVQNYEKGVIDKQTKTGAVMILWDEKDLQNILITSKLQRADQLHHKQILLGLQILEILRIVKDIHEHFQSSRQSFPQELQDLSTIPTV